MQSLPIETSVATPTGDIENDVLRILVRQLYGSGPTALLATGVNAALLVAVLKPLFATGSLVLWLVCLGTITAARVVLLGAYRSRGRDSANDRLWQALFVGGVFFSGLVWGATAFLFYPTESEAHRVFLVFVLGGMMAGATGAFAPAPSAYIAFTVPAFLPLALRLLSAGDTLSLTMGIMALLFASLTTVTVWKNHRILRDGVRSQLENTHLVAALTAEAARVRSLNDSLRGEVEERVAAATQLQHHREHLEAVVTTRTAELSQARARAQAASDAKTQFIATLSHEIRTPMNGLLGMLELLAPTHLAAQQRRHLELARESGRSVLRLVNDLLEVSKVEAGAVELAEEPFELPDVLDRVLAPFVVSARAKGVALTATVSPEVPVRLVGDPHRLAQIINNLVGNAVKFTESGRVEISVVRQSAALEPVLLEFRVRDTGVGIPAENQEVLFEPYRQATPGVARRYGGTGLGLSIAKGLVETMGGTLRVQSQPEEGSTFTFTARFRAAAGEQPEHRSPVGADLAPGDDPEETLNPATGSHLEALLVEDDPVSREYFRALLMRQGWAVQCVENGTDALEQWEKRPFDVILMDVELGGLNGLETTRRIREREAGRNHTTPILGVTAHAGDDARRRCLAAGMDQCLTKPVGAAQLCEAVARAVGAEKTPCLETDPLLPLVRVVDRLGGGAEKLRNLAGVLLTRWDEQLGALRKALTRQDRQAIESVAHGLFGSLSVYGLEYAAGVARQLEQLAPQVRWVELARHTEVLEGEFVKFRDALARRG